MRQLDGSRPDAKPRHVWLPRQADAIAIQIPNLETIVKKSSAVVSSLIPTPLSPVGTSLPLVEPVPEILGPDDVAKLLGVNVAYVFEKTRSRCANPLPSHSLGRYLRFFRHEVLAWVVDQPTQRQKRRYRLSPAARKALITRNKARKAVAA